MEPRADPAWDSFWRYDRLSSFHAAPGAPNYGPPVADGWRALFDELPNGARLLDLATGNGAIAVMAVEAGKRFAVTGADLAAVEPTAFVTRNREELAQITFLANPPAEALPLADASMDAIVSQYGVEYSDLSRSLPEAARVLAPAGACASPATPRKDHRARHRGQHRRRRLPDWARPRPLSGRGADKFNFGLKAIADRAPAATDVAMLANVHHSLCDTFDHRRGDLSATAARLVDEITAHRDRQTALLAAARTVARMRDIGAALETLGLISLAYGEQRDGADLIGHVIEARRA